MSMYMVMPLVVIHRGSWEYRFDVTAGGETDMVTFHFCIEEGEATDGTDHDAHGGS